MLCILRPVGIGDYGTYDGPLFTHVPSMIRYFFQPVDVKFMEQNSMFPHCNDSVVSFSWDVAVS